jgi:transcriptional regulator with XRE-family HTH domain
MPKQKTHPADYPQAVLTQIAQLGRNIAIARKRRGQSQAQWAKKLGVSQPTMARIERGDPAVAMASYAMCIWLINPNSDVAELIAPQHDLAALAQEVSMLQPKPTRKAAAKGRPASAQLAQPPLATSRPAGLAALLADPEVPSESPT